MLMANIIAPLRIQLVDFHKFDHKCWHILQRDAGVGIDHNLLMAGA